MTRSHDRPELHEIVRKQQDIYIYIYIRYIHIFYFEQQHKKLYPHFENTAFTLCLVNTLMSLHLEMCLDAFQRHIFREYLLLSL